MKSTVLILFLAVAIGLYVSAYTIDEKEQAIILEFGRPVGKAVVNSGLHFKLPWRQLVKFEKRILEYDAEPKAILSLDKKRLEVDNYARWKISDPLRFYRAVRTINGGLGRIDPIVYSELRVELGKHNLTEIINGLVSLIDNSEISSEFSAPCVIRAFCKGSSDVPGFS